MLRPSFRHALLPLDNRSNPLRDGLRSSITFIPTAKQVRPRRVRSKLRVHWTLHAWVWWALAGGLLSALIAHELRTSALQSYLLTRYAAGLSYEIGVGPSPRIQFPSSAPYDRRFGNSSLPDFTRRLEQQHYRVLEQSRMTEPMARLVDLGITPPYREPATAGLVIQGARGETLLDARRAEWLFGRFEDVPALVVESLLYIENRELLADVDPRENPAVDWNRLAKAGLLFAGRQVGLALSNEGGSTLATQIEKFRHSPGGRTGTAHDKLRQMAAASLKVYQSGADTRAQRHRIVVDYLNSMPLAAAPGYGEIHGLGEGLQAWFGLDLQNIRQAMTADGEPQQKAVAFKHALALLCAVRSPTRLLVEDRDALQARIAAYVRRLERVGVISPSFARSVLEVPLQFAAVTPPRNGVSASKEVTALRTQLLGMLGLPTLYDVNRLNLAVRSTIDLPLQQTVDQLFRELHDPKFLAANGLLGKHLLSSGDPRDVTYSFLLYEVAPQGNLVRVQTDSLQRSFDLNTMMKMELGSTAKLRTVAHYLELLAGLYDTLSGTPWIDPAALPADPITQWAISTLQEEPTLSLDAFLQRALERRYSASPWEVFFTGGGAHVFHNFDKDDNNHRLTVSTAIARSTNLVFIRLMRDLVRFHTARLSYDAEALISDANNPRRRRMLERIANEEATSTIAQAHRNYTGLSESEAVQRLLRGRASPRKLAVLYYAWNIGSDQQTLEDWLKANGADDTADVSKLERAYANPRLKLADYGYLLGLHPLEIWCAGELLRHPELSFAQLNARATEAKRVSSAWLFETRNRRAQDLRLRIKVERDAFARMTTDWQRLGFPFERLVPSYATAIGSSSDRPAALADLMGIIVNDGQRRPAFVIDELRFAADTPYHTVFGADSTASEQVMHPAVAQALRSVLAKVVEAGTAMRLKDALHHADGSVVTIGGKTGSGDNRYETFTRGGQVKSSRAVNRTAAFVFYIGAHHYGVITASVDGTKAQEYSFTSSLPLEVLKLLAPQLERLTAS